MSSRDKSITVEDLSPGRARILPHALLPHLLPDDFRQPHRPGTGVVAQFFLRQPRIAIPRARGGLYKGTPKDTQSSYVRDFLAFLGITDVEFVYAEGLAISEASKNASIAEAHRDIENLVEPLPLAA